VISTSVRAMRATAVGPYRYGLPILSIERISAWCSHERSGRRRNLIAQTPATDPDKRNYRIRLLLRVVTSNRSVGHG
jgi:hypothetical protein